jgi:hypothetical protein
MVEYGGSTGDISKVSIVALVLLHMAFVKYGGSTGGINKVWWI